MSSHLKNIEQSSGLFDPEHGEAERRGCVGDEVKLKVGGR